MQGISLEKLLEKISRGEETWNLLSAKIHERTRFENFSDPAIDEDDLEQELKIKVLCKCQKEGEHWTDKKGDEIESKTGYFWSMYKFTCLELRRDSKRRVQNRCQVEIEEGADSNPDFTSSTEIKEVINFIWGYEPKNPNWKIAARLYYIKDLSIAEIAEIMQVAKSTVKSWLHRWRTAIKESLRRRGVFK